MSTKSNASSRGNVKVKNPNESGKGFLWAVIAVIAIVAVVLGVVLYMGRSKQAEEVIANLPNDEVSFTATVADNVVTLAAPGSENAPVVDMYEDYSCHYCSQLFVDTGADMRDALNAGELVVNLRALNFLDRGQEGHSTRALAAFDAVAATGDARAAWNFHSMLLRDFQTVASWTDDELADAAANVGASADAVTAIRERSGIAAAKEVAQTNANDLQAAIGEVSSPHLLQNGQEIEQANWVSTVTGGQQ